MPQGDQDRAFTITEASSILGRTPDALRGLIRRGTLTAIRGNDGRHRVLLPENLATVATAERPPGHDGRWPMAATVATGRDELVAELRARLNKVEAERERLASELTELRNSAKAEADKLRERAARAEGEVGPLREALADLAARLDRAEVVLALPWWKRLFG